MEANKSKSEANLRFAAHVGGEQVRVESATAPRWGVRGQCRAAQIYKIKTNRVNKYMVTKKNPAPRKWHRISMIELSTISE